MIEDWWKRTQDFRVYVWGSRSRTRINRGFGWKFMS